MKNNLQQRASELHEFVALRAQPSNRRPDYAESVKALGVRLLQLTYEGRSDEFREHVSDVEFRARFMLTEQYDLGQPTVTEARGIFKAESKRFEALHKDKEANFCRMCSELFRCFDKTDFSQVSGCPRACVKAWYAGADMDSIKHAVLLLF